MTIERKFIEDAIIKEQVSHYLESELSRAGFSDIEIQKTPMLTRITVWVTNPGRVIGRGGETINTLTKAIADKFKIDNPQISVAEVTNPMLEPRLVARYLANALERGAHARGLLHSVLNDIMTNGALGAEIIVTGKLAAKGAKAKQIKLRQGFIPKAGDVVKLVKESRVTAYPKYGAIGVVVRIVKPGTVFPQPRRKEKQAKTQIVSGSAAQQQEQQQQTADAGAKSTNEAKQEAKDSKAQVQQQAAPQGSEQAKQEKGNK
ncbi:MAG: 30S ribosomal protein S3 [Candidatus Micrarchaeia archaeon]